MNVQTIDISTVVRRSKDQVSCNLNDEIAILNLKSTFYFGLNEVGAGVWQALGEARVVREVCKLVAEGFDVDEIQCEEDVLAFLIELREAGLIEVVPAKSPSADKSGVQIPRKLNPDELPKSWPICKLLRLHNALRGASPKGAQSPDMRGANAPWAQKLLKEMSSLQD